MQETILKSTSVQTQVDPFVDCANLLLISRDPVPEAKFCEELSTRARDNTQLLFNKIWELEKKRVDEAIVAVLPKAVYRLPREKKIPEAKVPTKWEKYAQEKGIKPRKKRAKKVFDEETKEWKPRYGFRRTNDGTKDWLIEVPDHKDPNEDMFEERRKLKKERIQKNELQKMRNVARRVKAKNASRLAIVDDASSIGIGKEPTDRGKQEIRVAADRAKFATASVGKFQEKLRKEKPNVKQGKKRKFEANLVDPGKENERNLEILKGVLAKKPKLQAHKLAEAAREEEGGKESGEKKGRTSRGGIRQKNSIHRQKHFLSKVKTNKKTRGNTKKN